MAQDPAAAPSPVPIITQLGVAAVGKGIFWMLNSGHEWVHRRSETVEFHDRKTVTRTVTAEFTLPDVIPTLRLASGPVRLVPVTLMDKHNLVHFELRDECGSAVPVLTAEENTVVGTAALVAAAADALSCAPQDVPEELRLQLRGIAGGTRQQRLACLAQREHWDARLERAQAFSLMVDRLAASFPVLVLLRAEPGDRRILRFCYDEIVNIHELEPDVEALRQRWIGPKAAELAVKVGAFVGWTATAVEFSTPSAVDTQSFHFEVKAPDGADITQASLAVGRRSSSRAYRHDWAPGGTPRVHLHVSRAASGSSGAARVWLRASRRGWLATACFSAIVTAMVLLLGYLWLQSAGPTIHPSPADAAAILVALPGVFATMLARPSEHAMAATLLLGVRALLILDALAAFAAAALLVSGLPDGLVIRLWGVLAIAAGWLAAMVLLSMVFPRLRTKAPTIETAASSSSRR